MLWAFTVACACSFPRGIEARISKLLRTREMLALKFGLSFTAVLWWLSLWLPSSWSSMAGPLLPYPYYRLTL